MRKQASVLQLARRNGRPGCRPPRTKEDLDHEAQLNLLTRPMTQLPLLPLPMFYDEGKGVLGYERPRSIV